MEQVVENDQRAALPDADRVGAFEQLSLLGLSAAQIARRTRTPARAVRTALEVTGSAVAAGAMRRHDLTPQQAAVIAEFDGDSEAVEALTAAVQREPERFEHVVQLLRGRPGGAGGGLRSRSRSECRSWSSPASAVRRRCSGCRI